MPLDLWRNMLPLAGIEHLKSCWASRTTQKPVSTFFLTFNWWCLLTFLICWQLTCGRLVAFLLRCLVESPFSKAETVSQWIYIYNLGHHSFYTYRCWSTQSNFGYSWYTGWRNFTACGQWKGKQTEGINGKRMICVTHMLVTQAQVYIRSLPHMPKILFQNLYPRGTLWSFFALKSPN